MVAEIDILTTLRKQRSPLPPFELRTITQNFIGINKDEIDAIIELAWGKRSWKFAAELKRLYTPKTLQSAVETITPKAKRQRLNPMIIVPYLAPATIAFLESIGVSGLDLCGNGIVTVPNEVLVVRKGEPNRFPQSVPIRNVYRGDSSLVGRAFLARPQYGAVGEIQATIRDLDGDVTLSTVSKVLKTLEGDLIVGREKGVIRLLQPDKLLDALKTNYQPPQAKDRYVGRIELSETEIQEALANAARKRGSKFILTGAASAANYAVLASEPIVAGYCNASPDELLAMLPERSARTDRFPNLNLTWTTDARVFFDPIREGSVSYASPVQAYLELASGDKRQRETSEQVREYVLRRLQKDGGRV